MVMNENEKKLLETLKQLKPTWLLQVNALHRGIEQTKSLYDSPVPVEVENILNTLKELIQLFNSHVFTDDPLKTNSAFIMWHCNEIKHYYRDDTLNADGDATQIFALYSLCCYKEEVSKRLELLKNYLGPNDSFCSETNAILSEIVLDYCKSLSKASNS